MAQAGRDESGINASMQLDPRDKIVSCLIVFFTAVALTFELYWLIFNQVMENRTDLLARAFALYWHVDYTYRVPGLSVAKSFTLALEGVILKPQPFRHALQLTVAAYTLYDVLLYYLSRTFPVTRSLRTRTQPHSCCSI
jgi:hypothetical protein